MSKYRDIQLDIENTKRKLKNLSVSTNSKKNWLGHKSEICKKIDEMLLKGATKKEFILEIKLLKNERPEDRVSEHIYHLKDTIEGHGLTIIEPEDENGIYKFDYPTTSKKEELEDAFSTKNGKIKDTERKAMVSQRIGQNILRKELLKLYNNKCAMCDVDAFEVLRASHIIPWSEDKDIRLDPTNAILLCGLHDLAFDKGLITVNNDFTISLPNKPDGLRDVLNKFTRSKLRLPASKEYHPKTEYLQRHKDINSK